MPHLQNRARGSRFWLRPPCGDKLARACLLLRQVRPADVESDDRDRRSGQVDRAAGQDLGHVRSRRVVPDVHEAAYLGTSLAEDLQEVVSIRLVQPRIVDHLGLAADLGADVLPGLPGSAGAGAEHEIRHKLLPGKPLPRRRRVPASPRTQGPLDVRAARQFACLGVPHDDELPSRCHRIHAPRQGCLGKGRHAGGRQVTRSPSVGRWSPALGRSAAGQAGAFSVGCSSSAGAAGPSAWPESDGAMPVCRRLAITIEATPIASAPSATPTRMPVLSAYLTTLVAIRSDTRFMTLISGLMAGPAVSLNGSPTVSPMTVAACASDPLPPKTPSSTSFFALSQAPPELARKTAIRTPAAMAPARNEPSGTYPKPKPITIGVSTASRPGVASSRSESFVQMSTTRPYSGFSVKFMIPGCVLNCSRTSKTTRPAARPTAMIARPEKKNTTDAPTMSPTSAFGRSIDRLKLLAARPSAVSTVVRKAPNRAVAASTAVAIAIPLVIALVVLPTASSLVSTCAAAPSTSPLISAMPWALSETGPKVSIETITPTVVSRPVPASATANSAIVALPVPSRNAPYTAAPISRAE